MKKNQASGFTMIEILLVVAIITILAAVTLPVSYSFLNKNDANLTVQKVVQTIRRAEFLSQANDSDSAWGVHLMTGSATIFKGTSYTGHDTSCDEIYTFPTTEIISGTTDFIFSKLTGYPVTPGVVTLTAADTSVKNITVNGLGMVQY